MTNITIHIIVLARRTAAPHLTKFLTNFSRVRYKRKFDKIRRKGKKRKERIKILSLRKRKETNAKFKLLKKEKLI